MNKTCFFISHQAALAICKAEGLRFAYLKESVQPGSDADAYCLKTGAKLTWNKYDHRYLIYGYHYAGEDLVPYRKYERK